MSTKAKCPPDGGCGAINELPTELVTLRVRLDESPPGVDAHLACALCGVAFYVPLTGHPKVVSELLNDGANIST